MKVEKLKALAEAATPGPWTVRPSEYSHDVVHSGMLLITSVVRNASDPSEKADAAYIAAANPAVVLELMAERDELLAALSGLFYAFPDKNSQRSAWALASIVLDKVGK